MQDSSNLPLSGNDSSDAALRITHIAQAAGDKMNVAVKDGLTRVPTYIYADSDYGVQQYQTEFLLYSYGCRLRPIKKFHFLCKTLVTSA